jgi:hypothetical protein
MLHNERHTLTVVELFLPSLPTFLFHRRATMVIDWDRYPGRLGNSGDTRAVQEMMERSDEGTARLLAELFETLLTLLVIDMM